MALTAMPPCRTPTFACAGAATASAAAAAATSGVHGARAAAIRPGVTARAGIPRGDTRRRDAADGQAVDAVALERHEARGVRVVEQRAHAPQVAEPLLADGGREQHRHGGRRRGGEVAGDGQERRERERVVADAGPAQHVAVADRLERGAGREDRVEVRGHDDRRAVAAHARQHVARSVLARFQARCGQAPRHLAPALGLGERRRRDRAELERVARGSLEIDRCAAQCAGAGAVSRRGG